MRRRKVNRYARAGRDIGCVEAGATVDERVARVDIEAVIAVAAGKAVGAKAEWTKGEANPRFVVTSLKRAECGPKYLYEKVYCARGDMENRIKECQLDLYADRTSAATMRANQLRLWLASFAYVLLCAVRRIGLHHTPFANASCGTIRLKLLKIGALVRISVRRIKIAMASSCPAAEVWGCAAVRLVAASARGSPA